MHICVKKAGATIAHRFVKPSDAYRAANGEDRMVGLFSSRGGGMVQQEQAVRPVRALLNCRSTFSLSLCITA